MKNLRKPVGAAILTLFVATGVAFLSQPIILTHAETATSDVNLNIGAVMSLSLDADSLDLSTTPHHFVSGTINATVSTNSQYGYTLTLEDVDDNTDLAHTNTAVSDSFSSDFSGSKTSSEMEDNTWGFSLNATDYFKVPANGSPVALKRTTDPMTTANETIPVTFGAQVGNIMSGAYVDSVLFTMYVNGQDGKPTNPDDPDNPPANPSNPGDPDDSGCAGIHCISTMQEMTPQICAASTTPKNIATTLDTDGSHHGDNNYIPATSVRDTRDNNVYTIKKLADGNCWMTQNLRITGTEITSDDSNLPEGSSFYIPSSNLSSFTNSFTTPAVYYDNTYGGYYNFYTATAGWGTLNVTSGNSPKDICPKGWRLPIIDRIDEGEFNTLYYAANRNREAMTQIAGFMWLAGYIQEGAFYKKGTYAGYWASGVYDQYSAFHLVVDDRSFTLGGGSYKMRGLSIHCIAK